MCKIILASASPQRRTLLSQLGLVFSVVPAHIDERKWSEETANSYVIRMAQQKAMTVFGQLDGPSEVVVIGADTCIVQGSDVIGKPNDEADARRILMRLSGKKHRVLSCVCLVVWDSESLNPKVQSKICESEVSFRVISENEIQQYWNTGEPVDKAGAYAIQGRAAIFIDAIHGSYSGIVGLPLYETCELLKSVGVESLLANSPVSK